MESEAYPWILYLDPLVHTEEYHLVKNAGLDFILVQDIRLSKGTRPPWLHVLPALVDTNDRLAYRGVSCLKKLLQIDLPPEHARRLRKH